VRTFRIRCPSAPTSMQPGHACCGGSCSSAGQPWRISAFCLPRHLQRAAWPPRRVAARAHTSSQQAHPSRLRVQDCGEALAGFGQCPAAGIQLGRRWGLLQHEGRWEQLAWEAKRVQAREPAWAPARRALCLALVELQRFAEAEAVAAEGASLQPEESVWRELGRHSSDRRQQKAPLARPPSAGDRAKVVVASLFCGKEFIESMRPARKNHERWCALHGYQYSCFEENFANRPDPTWSKILIVQRLFNEGAEYVFWMDADSLFIHDGVDLQWACELDRDFVFAGDLNVVFNAGHFLARRCDWTTKFLGDAFRIYPWPQWEDNGAMMIMLGGGSPDKPASWTPSFERVKVPTQTQEDCLRAMNDLIAPEVAPHVAVVPQHRMNAYEWPGGGGRAAPRRRGQGDDARR